MMHEVIYKLNPSIVTIIGDVAYDVDGNEIEYDLDAVETKAAELQAEKEAAKQAAEAKLAALGLTPDDLKALLG